MANRIWHGIPIFVSKSQPTARTRAAFNTAAFKTGNASYEEVGKLLSPAGEWGFTREIATAKPLVGNVIKKPGSGDYGQIELNILTDEDDDGQEILQELKSTQTLIAIKIGFDMKNTDGSHDAKDGATYLRGYVQGVTDPGGDAGSWMQTKAVITLTQEPLTVAKQA